MGTPVCPGGVTSSLISLAVLKDGSSSSHLWVQLILLSVFLEPMSAGPKKSDYNYQIHFDLLTQIEFFTIFAHLYVVLNSFLTSRLFLAFNLIFLDL